MSTKKLRKAINDENVRRIKLVAKMIEESLLAIHENLDDNEIMTAAQIMAQIKDYCDWGDRIWEVSEALEEEE